MGSACLSTRRNQQSAQVTADQETDLVSDLLAPIPRTAVVPAIRAVLGLSHSHADRIVEAFDDFVAKPLESNLRKLNGRDLAKRNPMIYTARGIDRVEEWADAVLADKETSAIESHIGTFMEEVARIISGGIKPGNGVDLQIQDDDGVVHLFAIQAAPNTKNAGGRKSDIEALKRAARPLRGHRQRVEMYVAVLGGRAKTTSMRTEPDITMLGSDDFWARVSGTADFRPRLLQASTILSWLVKRRSEDEIARIKAEAVELFGDPDGRLNLAALGTAGSATASSEASGRGSRARM